MTFSYTSHVGFISIRRVSLTHLVLVLYLCRECLLHIPCCLHIYAGSFSYRSQAAFIFMWGASLSHPMLASFYAGSFSYTSRADFFFYVGSFFYTFHSGGVRCEKLLSSAVCSEDNSLRKELDGSLHRRKVSKSHTQTREGSPRTT